MTLPGPSCQECTGYCHENVPAQFGLWFTELLTSSHPQMSSPHCLDYKSAIKDQGYVFCMTVSVTVKHGENPCLS